MPAGWALPAAIGRGLTCCRERSTIVDDQP